MKCAIRTIVDYNNYGNRLQNYALQEILKKKGFEVVTIKNHYTKKNAKKNYVNLLMSNQILNKINNKYKNFKYKKVNNERINNFLEFTKTYIAETANNYEKMPSNDKDFDDIDIFFIGSDQVWNYSFDRFSEFDFLTFTNKPKISYAASFGVTSIPKEYEEIYKDGLNQLDFISVREKAGERIVREFTNKKVTTVLDPTLMLTQSEWLKLASKGKKYKDKFILTYFLDEPMLEDRKYYENFASKYNYKIKQLGTIKDLELWKANPAEFINLFSQAEAIFTDSFHACVFSIIFEKYFEVFERNTKLPSMNSRIDTLFDDLHLNSRWHNAGSHYEKIDYLNVHKLLKARQQESLNFIDNAIIETQKNNGDN
ncbi:polysaccharide pyruvyl transferase family protein [Enterococcus bulliens]